jgi:hypothetical protein
MANVPHTPGNCNCALWCPDYDDCACMYTYGSGGGCRCICEDHPGPAEVEAQFPTRLDDMVNFDLRGASLTKVGSFLADFVDADLYVPAHRLEERQEFFLEAVPLQMVISALGMIAVPRSAARSDPN